MKDLIHKGISRRLIIFVVAIIGVSANVMGQQIEAMEFEEEENLDILPSYPLFSIKTNALPWFGGIPNIGGEIKANDHISVDLALWWCPWKISQRYSLKTFSILPEVRYWLARNWKGHFFGLHLTASWFNLRFKDDRYQDYDRPLLGAGVTYGYYFEFNPEWGMELYIGAGYMNMQYDRYYNIPTVL